MGDIKYKAEKVHQAIPQMMDDLKSGKMSRREFLRTTTLLGLSAGAAYGISNRLLGRSFFPEARAAAGARGGTLKCSMRVMELSDPSTSDWVPKSNLARTLVEFLTVTGPDNITRPYLCERWEASEDLKTWTLHLRKGIKWSNGDAFGADDVVFNFERWLDPATGSSNIGLFGSMVTEKDGKKSMTPGAVEKVDDHTVRLHLNRPELAIPENLYNYPTAIVHHRFSEEGGDLSKNPVGTGPYQLEEFRVGEKAVFTKRPGYWGGDVSLDKIIYVDHGDERAAAIGALASGQVDLIYELFVDQLEVIDSLPDAQLFEAVTAQTAVARMRVSHKPFDNKELRQAFQACIDHERVLELAYRGRGAVAENHHVSPIHPEYFAMAKVKPDIEKAKQRLKEAGHADGINVSIDANNDAKWEIDAIQAMVQMWKPAGIDVKINVMPGSQYWDVWDKTPFGMTSWTHRPLGVMVLNLAYRSGVPWNESNYSNPDFDQALDEASGELDVNERRTKMENVQQILQDDGVIVQPLWRSVFAAGSTKVHGFKMHPTIYHQLNDVSVG